MARANRFQGRGGLFHVTHRCHNQEFLLKFIHDRNAYRAKLWEHIGRYRLSVLDYCVTCNHVHLLVDAPDCSELSGFMREVQGEFAKSYNRRKKRQNAVWGDSYHATLIESGDYLWRCLCYIELNMVRCGAVKHPREWKWSGYPEIMGTRQRYRLLDLEQLCWRLRAASLAEVRRNLEVKLAELIAAGQTNREPCWTESLAVGSARFVQELQPADFSRRETERIELESNLWVMREPAMPYSVNMAAEKRG